MKLQLKKYTQLTKDLTVYVKNLNTLELNDTAKTLLNTLPLDLVDTTSLLDRYKYQTASKLPNFEVYKASGIDLSKQIPDCEVTKAAIDSVVTMRTGFNQFTTIQRFISYDVKIGLFVVNGAGNAAITAAVITLTPEQETVWNGVHALFTLLADSDLNKKILSDNVYNDFKKELNLDTLVYEIQQKVK
ncbi:hypothetical protein [Hymenobacter terricola]|uniref:hypothetical protein n=1 Tax=Hymenobacter terricola TaxID=2819236 RepID=UPI001B302559|nr:hypothetical protein [Hymenobacter terricola]